MLNWRTIVPGNDPKHLIRGTELERCIPTGFRSRFAIYSVRTVGWQRDETSLSGGYSVYDVRYRVRDVEAANDQHFKDGKPAPIFGEYATLDEALAAIEPHRVIEPVE